MVGMLYKKYKARSCEVWFPGVDWLKQAANGYSDTARPVIQLRTDLTSLRRTFTYASMHDSLTVCLDSGMFSAGGCLGVVRYWSAIVT